MRNVRPSFGKRVAGRRLASSAQPPRVTPVAAQRPSLPLTPQPLRSISFLDKSSALLEGLQRFTAFRPLPVLVEKPQIHAAYAPSRVWHEDLPSQSSFPSEVCR